MSDYNWCHGPECHTIETQSRIRGSGRDKVLRTRKAKWTDKCQEFIAQAGHNCLTFLDLEATERYGKDQYRMATDKITPWSIS